MAVAGRSEAAHRPRPLRVVRGVAGTVAAFAAANLDLADHVPLWVGQTGREQRPHGQHAGGSVAADPAHIARAADLLAVQLRQTVDKSAQPVGRDVLFAIPVYVRLRIPQAEVGAEVDDAIGQLRKIGDAAHRAAVGQSQHQQVARRQLSRADELQFRPPAQVRMGEMDERSGVALAGHLGHFNVGMIQQQTQQLTTGIAAGAEDGD